jgi:hypothetical protein
MTWRHRSGVELDETSHTRYRSGLQVDLGRGWSTDWRLQREYDGRQRLVQRTVSYRSRDGRLRRLRFGNYTTRLGLGTILGYRGRVLSRHQEFDDENWLYPDYGGLNGLSAQLRIGSQDLDLALASQRNQEHSINTAVLSVNRVHGGFRPGLILGVNRLHSRHVGTTIYDVKYGGYGRYHYGSGYSAAEVTLQAEARPSVGALVLEGAHRFRQAEMQYAGWFYDDDYLDISGGSKAGNLRRSVTIDDVDLTISDKRSGQQGMLVKSIVLLGDQTELANSLLWAGRSRGTQLSQFLSSVSYRSSPAWTTTIDYLLYRRLSAGAGNDNETVQHRTRIAGRYRSSSLALRLAFAYVTQRSRHDGLAILMRLDILQQPWGECQLWANVSRLQLSSMSIENASGYIRLSHGLARQIHLATRLSHRYSRGRIDDHEATLSLELVARL